MKFETYIPCNLLRPYVQYFAIQETIEEKAYTVLPGTALVAGFQYKGKLSHLDNGKDIRLSPAGITGLQDSYRIFKNIAGTGTVLVYFKETGAAAFFRQPLHELFGQSISLDNFMLHSELLILEEQLCEAGTDAEKIQVIEDFLVSRLTAVEPDKLVLAAISFIYRCRGNIRISELMQQLYISQSPLEKRFRQAVGTSPKKFVDIVRMKHAIQLYQPGSPLTGIGHEAGFYDQAHFIKVFKTFTGETPEEYFRNK